MIKSAALPGLPVVDLGTGQNLGRVKSLVLNAQEKAVVALVLDDGRWYLGVKLLLWPDLVGVGTDAITVTGKETIKSLVDCPDLEKWLAMSLDLTDTPVMSKSGKIWGKARGYTLDRQGRLTSCEIERDNGETLTLAATDIIALGKEVVIADDATSITAVSAKDDQDDDNKIARQTDYTSPVPALEPAPMESSQLLGRRAKQRVETDKGVLIVAAGEEITEAVLQKARLAGKYEELCRSTNHK